MKWLALVLPLAAACAVDRGTDDAAPGFRVESSPEEAATTDDAKNGDAAAPSPANGTAASDCGPAKQAFQALHAALSPTCSGCHTKGPGPAFFGADADATHALFKGRSYQLPKSTLATKGAHSGPALTAAQKTALDAWVAAEDGCTVPGAPPAAPAPARDNAFTGAPAFVAKTGPSTRQQQEDHPWANGSPKGQNCTSCHDDLFTGGTIFEDVAGTKPAAGVEVRVRDAAGTAVSAWTDRDGNFFIKKRPDLQLPAMVGVRSATATATMGGTISEGGCASCHVTGKTAPIHLSPR